MAAGELPPPPIMHLIDLAGMEVEEGSVTFFLDPQEFHYNPLGTVHGGVISTLLDSAAACSLHSHPAGRRRLHLARPQREVPAPGHRDSGRLACQGTVLQRGRRTALAEARLTDSQGRLIAHATSSCMIFEAP